MAQTAKIFIGVRCGADKWRQNVQYITTLIQSVATDPPQTSDQRHIMRLASFYLGQHAMLYKCMTHFGFEDFEANLNDRIPFLRQPDFTDQELLHHLRLLSTFKGSRRACPPCVSTSRFCCDCILGRVRYRPAVW
jgi:hypothetical protein